MTEKILKTRGPEVYYSHYDEKADYDGNVTDRTETRYVKQMDYTKGYKQLSYVRSMLDGTARYASSEMLRNACIFICSVITMSSLVAPRMVDVLIWGKTTIEVETITYWYQAI